MTNVFKSYNSSPQVCEHSSFLYFLVASSDIASFCRDVPCNFPEDTASPHNRTKGVWEGGRETSVAKKADSEHNPPFFSFFQPIRGVHRFTENWGEVNKHIFLDSTVVLPWSWM